jgi:transcriptional regulator with XRE-family HTH domain
MTKRRYQRKPYKPVSYERFRETRQLAGLSRQQAAALLFVSLRTVQLWESGRVRIPYAAFRLLRVCTGYELPGSSWRGWKLSGDVLVSPEGKNFSACDLNALALTFAIARQWKKDYSEKQSRERGAKATERSGDASKPSPLHLVKGGKA